MLLVVEGKDTGKESVHVSNLINSIQPSIWMIERNVSALFEQFVRLRDRIMSSNKIGSALWSAIEISRFWCRDSEGLVRHYMQHVGLGFFLTVSESPL